MAVKITASPGGDGYVFKTSTSSWSGARDAISGTGFSSSVQSTSVYGARATKASGGRGSSWLVARSFFTFTTSRITQVPIKATLGITGRTNEGTTIALVASNHGTSISTADFDAIVGWDNSGVPNHANVTYWGPNTAISWDRDVLNLIELNDAARKDIASSSTFTCCILDYNYDLRNAEPTSGDANYIGCYYADTTDSSRKPYIELEMDNSTFIGANF
jgi:hypothetical protein